MAELRIVIPDRLEAKLQSAMPDYLDRKGFVCLLLDQALTEVGNLPAYRVGAGTQETHRPPAALEAVKAVEANTPHQPSEPSAASSEAQAKIPQPLTEVHSLGEKLEPVVPKKNTRAKSKDPFSSRQLPSNAIPNDLLDCQQLIEEFWSGKKGSRSTSIFSRICNKLRTWPPEIRREALERAINSGWGDVYEPAISKAKKDDFDWNQLTGLSI